MRAKFHDFAVIVGGGVDEDGLWLGGAESFVEIGVVEGWVEMKFCGVAVEEGTVGFGDGYDLDVGAIEGVGEEAVGVAVDQAGDDYAEGWFVVCGVEGDCEYEGEYDLRGLAKKSGWHADEPRKTKG